MPIRPYWAPGRGHWLLARRSISDPSEIAYYTCYAERRTSLNTLIWVARRRWPVEECFKQAKQEAGLDHYQVRTWRGWYAHITLSMLALAWLAVVRAGEHQKGAPEQAGEARFAAIHGAVLGGWAGDDRHGRTARKYA